MKNFIFVIIGLIVVISSCTRSGEDIDFKEISNNTYINDYISYNAYFVNEFNEINKDDISYTKSSDFYFLDYCVVMSYTQLVECMNSNSTNDFILDDYIDEAMKNFFNIFDSVDYNQIMNLLNKYLENGGHNPDLLLEHLNELKNKNLKDFLIILYAYIDSWGSSNFWKFLNEEDEEINTLMMPGDGGINPSREYNCRVIFWNRLKLIAISSVSDYMLSVLLGPDMPSADFLVTVAGMAGAVDARFEYYKCCGMRI